MEYQRSRSLFDPAQRISKLNLVFLSYYCVIWNQSSYESSWVNGMKINTNELGHMTKVAAMPIYGKNLQISSSPEPIDQWPWNLVCSIRYLSTPKLVQMMTLGLP